MTKKGTIKFERRTKRKWRGRQNTFQIMGARNGPTKASKYGRMSLSKLEMVLTCQCELWPYPS